MRLILASQSPFRKHALDILGLTYETIPSHVDEKAIRHQDPKILVETLAKIKAKTIAEMHPDAIIIAADLFIVHDNIIKEKPDTLEQAQEMIKSFSNETFDIISGLVVHNAQTGSVLSSVDVCKVHFRELSDAEIQDYIKRYPVLKCAGSFEADGLLRFADRIEGSYNFKAGLPVDKLVLFLKENKVI